MSKSDKYFLGNVLYVKKFVFFVDFLPNSIKNHIRVMCFSEIIRIFVPDIQNSHFYNNHYYYAYWYNYNPCCYSRFLCGW